MNPGPEPHFDADDRFIHRCCICGGNAWFGYSVSLRGDKLGTWYCGACRPDKPIVRDANEATQLLEQGEDQQAKPAAHEATGFKP